MTIHKMCNLCSKPGTLATAQDVRSIQCNVRRFSKEYFTVWRCNACGSLHCLESVDLAPYYAAYPVKTHKLDFWTRAAYSNYLSWISAAGVHPGQSVLDFGCGPGLLISFLQGRGFTNATGFDAHVSSFSNRAALERRYDVILSQDVIEHMEEPSEFIQELADLVEPNGIVCIGTPRADGIDLQAAETYSLSLHVPYHRHILSEKVLLAMGHAAGLKPLKIHRRFYYDTLYPTVNYRFLRTYVRKAGNFLDNAFESPRFGLVATSPALWFFALAGYFFPPRSEMVVIFRKAA